MIDLMVNGEPLALDKPTTVLGLLARYDLHDKMVVVEYNAVILAREAFGGTQLADGDVLEIVQMMAGG